MSDLGSKCVPLTGTIVDVDRVGFDPADIGSIDGDRADGGPASVAAQT
jgi:hypothetical protein